MVDLREAGERSAGRNIANDLKDLVFQLGRFQSADKLVERLSADEREEVRLGIEAVMRIKAALDRLGQRNAQLHNERQRLRRPGKRPFPWSGTFVQRALRAALPGRTEALPLARHPVRLGDRAGVIFGGNLMPTSAPPSVSTSLRMTSL